MSTTSVYLSYALMTLPCFAHGAIVLLMRIPSCPKCHRTNVEVRNSARTGRDYLANVAIYPHATYFRSVHTREECAAESAAFEAKVQADIAKREADEASNARFVQGQVLLARYAAIYGSENVGKRWDAIAAKWL